MKKVERMELIEANNAKNYQESLNKVIEELQASNLEVEISHSMSPAHKGIGYLYSAVIIGRQG